ncbi:MAG: hypothetical protein ABR526_12020 [Chthoniobacterales bacterium]
MAGGVGDYTEQLIRHWPHEQHFEFIVPTPTSCRVQTLGSHQVREVNRDSRAFAAQLPADGAVLLQYSAYGFSRYGYPHWLIDALVDWKRKARGSLCVMFHEIWAFWPWWNKNFPLQLLHRRAIANLLNAADTVFTSTASQADHLSKVARGVQVTVLPVGSNIIPGERAMAVREAGTAVLFGTQGTRLRALREMSTELRVLAATSRVTRIVTIGAGNSAAQDADERGLLESLNLSAGFRQLGKKSTPEISAVLATAEFAIAAQDPLSYTKSGTFMAYAAHGLNILSNYADASAPEPMCLLISPAELRRNLDPGDAMARARKLRAWYERTASWPQIARQIAAAVEARPHP